MRKTKRIEKFDGLEPRRCEDMKAFVAPEIGPKSFGTSEKQGPDFFRSGNTKASLYAFGNSPVCKEVLISGVRVGLEHHID